MKVIIALFLSLTAGFFSAFAQAGVPPLSISHLTGNFYIYTTYKVYEGEKVASNSMYLVTDEGVVMFDTPWDTTQFQPLLDSIKSKHGKEVVMALTTHSHEDRSGGLGFLRRKGIKTYTSKQTYLLLKQYHDRQADFYFEKDTVFSVGQHSFATYYGGEGHTKDNIVIWFEDEQLLYGGCLVKSVEATNLGNTREANVEEWSATIANLQEKFPQPRYIIPGHGGWKSTRALEHTLHLLRQHTATEDN